MRPRDISWAGWRDIALRIKSEIGRDHVSLVAAGVAFYGLLALFPAIAALVSAWGLMFHPQQIEQQIAQVSAALPNEAASIIQAQARSVVSGGGAGLNLTGLGGLVLTIYSATKGVKSLIEGLNIIYDEREKRGIIKLNLLAFGLTLALILTMLGALGLIIVLPVLVGGLGISSAVTGLLTYTRWPLLALVAVVGLAVLYQVAPSRPWPGWRWVSWGAVAATALWVIVSILFSIYVRNFGSYNETYGSIGAVVVLLMWFWLSAFAVLMGGELNAEMERQRRRRKKKGTAGPNGDCGAGGADPGGVGTGGAGD